ncbi:hypothetical protein [Methylacidimicrobium sp. B4]|nr:hypothetical protein [Methylacidimicrobium sp. B4]QSR84922.1 hypothetical protein MacB4_01190 [Methylacidimicrobium sp. B4]
MSVDVSVVARGAMAPAAYGWEAARLTVIPKPRATPFGSWIETSYALL